MILLLLYCTVLYCEDDVFDFCLAINASLRPSLALCGERKPCVRKDDGNEINDDTNNYSYTMVSMRFLTPGVPAVPGTVVILAW